MGNVIVVNENDFSFGYAKDMFKNVSNQGRNLTSALKITSDECLLLQNFGTKTTFPCKSILLEEGEPLEQTTNLAMLLNHGSFNPVHKTISR